MIAQYVSGIGITLYTWIRFPHLLRPDPTSGCAVSRIKRSPAFSALTCLQQSIMNLGILAVQGLVNSFGTTIMAAFAAAVKIDAFAYLPVQGFRKCLLHLHCTELRGRNSDRIRKGIRHSCHNLHGFQPDHLPAGLHLCPAAHVPFHRRRRDGRDHRRRPLPADRRRILRPDRHPVPSLRTLPGAWEARHVGRPHRRVARHAGCACIRPLRGPILRGCGDLVGRAHRLVPGRCAGRHLLSVPSISQLALKAASDSSSRPRKVRIPGPVPILPGCCAHPQTRRHASMPFFAVGKPGLWETSAYLTEAPFSTAIPTASSLPMDLARVIPRS